ncbi:hypothetical protein H2O64_16090 [Kordia sp. YSTF-M3]|uniref:Bacteriocin n=1 Tax=Kordia aestuariivivens TaxID=2759037 RepID=A0ABR7QCF5_9FLAO|nr:hypothetical protein [Kordia aestuariivivens]MBC8756198.1 hypothetical protein [Kordia aestuariivivens]
MKKRDLNSLKLNKKVISNLSDKNKITGGSAIECALTMWVCPIVSYTISLAVCPDDSANGCTTTPDETMTCADWSCGCPEK